MATQVKVVEVRMVRGINDLSGKEEFCKIKVPQEMINCMIERSVLEKAVGEKINVEVGHNAVKLLYIDGKRNVIFGHESAKRYVRTDLTIEQIKADYKRRQAVTTISGLLAKEGFDFPAERVTANMEKWKFTIADLQAYSQSVGKWSRVQKRLIALGLLK